MARLPKPGGDVNEWGTILNDFLSVEHNADGTLKASSSLAAKEPAITPGGVGQYWRGDKTWQSLDTDSALGSNSDFKIASQKAVKSYVDSQTAASITPDATPSAKGKVQLAGDLGGSASAPLAKTRTHSATIGTAGMAADYVCTGVNDDIPIQAAITAVGAAGGGTIFLRAGVYRIANTITMAPFVRLVGERFTKIASGGVTLQTAASVTLTSMFTATGNPNPATNSDLLHDIGFENITFSGNNTTSNILALTNQDTCKVVDCRLIGATNSIKTVWNSSSDPVAATIPGGLFIDRCIVSANSGIGIDLQYQTQCWISNSWFSGNAASKWINFNASNKIHVTNCEFDSATQALYFSDTTSFPTNDITVNNCTFTMSSGNKAWTEARTSAGSDRVAVVGYTITGGVTYDKLIGSHNLTYGSDGMGPALVQAQAAADKILTLKAAASQSGRYIDIQNSSGASISFLNNGGNWYVNNGSASSVAYGFASEINSGLYRIGTNQVGFSVNGAQKLQIDTNGLSLSGALALNHTVVADANYTPLATDSVIAYGSLTAARTVTLPSAVGAAGRIYIIKDESGAAGSNNITVSTTGGQTIDNTASKLLNTNYGFLRLYSNGVNWFSI
ncbi:MAG TPA: right-handed parallel beta-helix repeat-containing protein [Candidatus Saccharimonadales bacterium]|nr:right-handed parallel beta-helix repeat-containing protein [Candidatus Saccharimonadales bacterium]